MLGLYDVQYLYEFVFWLVTFLILKKVWHRPKVRLYYGYTCALLNGVAVLFFTLMSLTGNLSSLDAFSFGFLHALVAMVMLTLVRQSQKL
ncbi:MAG: hypothetical protein ACON47_06715 [Flavobacteriaceae bacterium]